MSETLSARDRRPEAGDLLHVHTNGYDLYIYVQGESVKYLDCLQVSMGDMTVYVTPQELADSWATYESRADGGLTTKEAA